jgi:hypothetical protein
MYGLIKKEYGIYLLFRHIIQQTDGNKDQLIILQLPNGSDSNSK